MNSSRRTQALLRLLFTLILAAGLHLALFTTLSFGPIITPPAGNTLQLTLTSPSPEPKPEPKPEPQRVADITAKPPAATIKANEPVVKKAASKPPATPKVAASTKTTPAKPKPPAPVTQSAPQPAPPQKTPEETAPAQAAVASESPQTPKLSTGSLIARSMTLARNNNLTGFGAAPVGQRTKRLVAGKKASLEENSYLRHWREKVQRIGVRNYPESARNEKLSGNLRLLVTLRADGSLEEAIVLISSGNRELDDAAIRIVKLAAPFRPFPVEMKKKIDRLEIVRTWKFENNTVVY